MKKGRQRKHTRKHNTRSHKQTDTNRETHKQRTISARLTEAFIPFIPKFTRYSPRCSGSTSLLIWRNSSSVPPHLSFLLYFFVLYFLSFPIPRLPPLIACNHWPSYRTRVSKSALESQGRERKRGVIICFTLRQVTYTAIYLVASLWKSSFD